MLRPAEVERAPDRCKPRGEDRLLADYLTWWDAENRSRRSETIRFEGCDFYVDRKVFSPALRLTYSTFFTSQFLRDTAGKQVLDQGTGCGVLAILAAKRGAREVAAVDIDPAAVANANENVRRYRLSKKVRVLQGDVFAPPETLFGKAEPVEKFDIVIANLPIASGAEAWRHLHADFAKNLFRWAHQLKDVLADDGVAYLSWASFGDQELPGKALREAGLTAREFTERTFGVTWQVFEVTL